MGAPYPWAVWIPDECADCSCSFLCNFIYLTIWNYPDNWVSTQNWSWIEWIIRDHYFQSLCSNTLCQTGPIVDQKKKQYQTSLIDEINCLQTFFHKMLIHLRAKMILLPVCRLFFLYSQSALLGFKLMSPTVKTSLSAASSASRTGAVFLTWKTKHWFMFATSIY